MESVLAVSVVAIAEEQPRVVAAVAGTDGGKFGAAVVEQVEIVVGFVAVFAAVQVEFVEGIVLVAVAELGTLEVILAAVKVGQVVVMLVVGVVVVVRLVSE